MHRPRPQVGGGFIITEAEVDDDNANNDEVETEETRENREFINDNESFEDEVEQRLAWINREFREATSNDKTCKHCVKFFAPDKIIEHEKKCEERLVSCFKCNNKFAVRTIKQHYKNCTVAPKRRPAKPVQTGEAERRKNGRADGEGAKEKKKKKRKRKGRQFKLQMHGAKKYKVLKRLREFDVDSGLYEMPGWIKQFIIGNEFGAGPKPNPHCHAVCVTFQKMNFKEFKALFKMKTKIHIDDIQSCKNLKHEVKYVCKEDYRPMNYNFDWDMMTQIVLAYVCAQKYNTVTNTTYPYCRLTPFQKRDFLKAFTEFKDQRHGDLARLKSEVCVLRRWQETLLRIVKNFESDRKIIWAFDEVGNHGKTHFSVYLEDMHQAKRVVGGMTTKDFAYSYNYEELVVFDFDRDSKDTVNYRLLENLKDGALWSPKYESETKRFRHLTVQVLVVANFEPEYERLSLDRWHVLKLERGNLKRYKSPRLLALQALQAVQNDELVLHEIDVNVE